MAEHVFDRDAYHHVWDREIPTALTVAPGDVVHFDILMAGEGQIADGYTYEDCTFDFDTLYNLCGPVDVAGAEVGDMLEIEILVARDGPVWLVRVPGGRRPAPGRLPGAVRPPLRPHEGRHDAAL